MNDYTKMLTEAMSVELKDEEFNAAEAVMDLGLCDVFTKIVYISNKYSNDGIHLIASRCDLTLININDGDKTTWKRYDTHKLISIAESDLFGRVHKLTL
jgi:hypothetical protein